MARLGARGLLVPAVIAAVAVADLAWRGWAPAASSDGRAQPASAEPPEPPAAGPEVVALLDGLRPGDALAGWEVQRIGAPRERQVRIDLRRGELEWPLWVALRGAQPDRLSPRETARYALFYGHLPDGGVDAPSLQQTLDALAARLERTEQRVPVPPGL